MGGLLCGFYLQSLNYNMLVNNFSSAFKISDAVLTFKDFRWLGLILRVCTPPQLPAILNRGEVMDADLNKSVICGHTNDK